MNVNILLEDEMPPDDDNDQPRIRPSMFLGDRMLADAIPPAMQRDLNRKRSIVVIIEAPSQGWFEVLLPTVQFDFRPAELISREEKLTKNASLTQNHALRTSIEVGHSLIALVTNAETQLSPELIASADYKIRVPYPSNAQLNATLRAFYGNKRIAKLPPDLGQRVHASAIFGAMRPGENVGRAVARLHQLDKRIRGRLAQCDALPKGPTLSELTGYGAGKAWGLALAEDLQAYRRGELDWTELSTAALLHGPPGTGKTMFASALARSCSVPIIATSLGQLFAGSDGYLNSMTKALDETFRSARDQAPSVLFLDEIDAIPNRADLDRRGRDYWTTLVTHLLKLLDDGRDGVIVVAATNMIDRLDAALTRSGRLEFHFEIKLPTAAELVGVFRYHLAGRLPESDLVALAQLAQGSTGADAAFRSKVAISDARRAGRPLTFRDVALQFLNDDVEGEDLLHRIAIHEAGHAVVALALGRQVDHASTVPVGARGGGILTDGVGAIGTRQRLEDQVVIMLAGRAAEILLLGEGSSGCHVDLALATSYACAIHGSFGLGDSLLHRGPASDPARLLADPRFREQIEAELRILDQRCTKLLAAHRPKLEAIAGALEKKRALTGDELRKLFK
ncbi:Cdc6-like AAA superfamily ATPase [Bosea sp. BE271]|uniref:AAA family ATPase n=1 Tax=Bosea TaxID=85413 RepID=UPI0028610C37|nr:MULTISPECIES: AAA family ATPase [Bosea]MDR6827686.1 Cdc6-like AAA superfamily ATPase [Bosea robiniae]MDR6894620.1 Cdc6-like AAA superfamily ATPase [Bosea sp. BE109]MDR7137792.1 Cdc6-like AAA superfamily ATPase [Bosea sp. BE168]MDR7174491.1 Cdc6-like AAA superfamily ATPase [Bosea sp. BE271]